MTKDRPIGLVVGLLFIIGFGLILSQLMGTEEKLPPPPAQMEENPDAYASTHAIDDSARYTPVSAGVDLQSAIAGGGPLGGNSVVESRMAPPSSDDREGVIVSELGRDTATLAATRTLETGAGLPARGGDRLAGAATGLGTLYVGPDGISRVAPTGRAGDAPEAARGRTYVVQAHDTLIGIARKLYGAGKDREYKRIYEANRGVMRSESDLSVGWELTIPPLPAPAAASTPADGASGRLAAGQADRAAGAVGAADRTGQGRYITASMDDLPATLAHMGRGAAPAAGRSYVVQRGDRLRTIARRMMNDDSPAAVRKLFEANRGVLDSPDRLKIGVELKLPL